MSNEIIAAHTCTVLQVAIGNFIYPEEVCEAKEEPGRREPHQETSLTDNLTPIWVLERKALRGRAKRLTDPSWCRSARNDPLAK